MEDYSKWFENETFPCPLCEEELEIKISKKGKPYVVCDVCGVQLFVRRAEGIKRLKREIDSLW